MTTINFLTIINLIIALCTFIGGYIAFRYGVQKQAGEIQEHVIAALDAEMSVLRSRIEHLEKENERQAQIISTIKAAMRKRGFIISIDGEIVYVQNGGTTQAQHIQGSN